MEVAPDHVHLLVEYDPHHSISQVVKAFKGRIPRRADALYKASKINPTMSKGGFLSLELPCLRHALAFDLLPPECIPIPHRLTLQDTSRTRQCGMDIVS
ncbi:MAG: transposase [Nostoc sp.]|uniref:transposase n=1 Tax=Nostoc sp. TaxID=1180 RepID=UPI002FF7344D